MYWLILVVSGMFEAVWATALGRTEGFTKLVPTLVFAVAVVISMGGLAYAMRGIPVGTAYVVWVGIGATLTAVYSMVVGTEQITFGKIFFLMVIIGGVIGLKTVSEA